MDKRPFASFFVVLGTVFLLIVISNLVGNPKPKEDEILSQTKQVSVYTVGSAPIITVAAQIEKSGVITINSLTGGVVANIYKGVGEHFNRGQVLIGLSTNYQGGNLFSLQRQLAKQQYDNTLATFDLQKDTIKKQRERAEKDDADSDELRSITDKSLEETRSLISLNENILTSIDNDLTELEQTNVNGANDELIFKTKQLKSQFLAATNGARQALRNAEYQAASDKPPAELSNLDKDIALKQLDLQDKMLELNREVSRINLQIAQVNEGLMFPAAPFSGTVQRVLVKAGQAITPGMPLVVLSEDIANDPVTAIAYVSPDIARRVSRMEETTIHISENISYTVYPSYITGDAVQGTLHAIYFPVPDQYSSQVTERGYIQVDIPIGYSDTSSFIPFIPIDAIYQTKDSNFLFVAEGDTVVSREIELGQIYGSFVEIESGLQNSDKVILDRTVVAGDKVSILQD